MKKLLAFGILAIIPTGISVVLYITGGPGKLLLFWTLIAGCVVVGWVAAWALEEISD